MRKTRTAGSLLLAAGILILAHGTMPGAAEAQQPRSLDEQLLDDLNTDPLDDIDRELFGPGEEQGRAGEAPDPDGGDLAERLKRELGAAGISEDDDPLLEVARRMREVEGLIGQNDSGPATQGLQKQIVAGLDDLIQQARKRCGQCKSGKKPGSKSSRRVPSDSPAGPPGPKKGSGGGKQPGPTVAYKHDKPNPARAPVRRVDVGQVREAMRQLWGMLPEREREQMMQLPAEEFLPKYELLIEEYFRRLSEEKDMMIDD